MSQRYIVLAALVLGFSGYVIVAQRDPVRTAQRAFLVEPYIQLGNNPRLSDPENLALLWHTSDSDDQWSVRPRLRNTEDWKSVSAPKVRRITAQGIETHRIYEAALTGLIPGAKFDYQVLKKGNRVFGATARARRRSEEPQKFAVFGDCGADTPSQRAIAFQVFLAEPDFVFIPGDIVYTAGRISEYRTRFYPIYNADDAALEKGASLLRTTLFVAAPGNHDLANRNLGKFPDLLAYFLYWLQPLNGPIESAGAPNSPAIEGPAEDQAAFLKSAGSTYPRMANFSFDFGNAHWTVLDSNRYVDWTNKVLRDWVAKDLAAAKDAAWRFVAYHHPGFNSSKIHFHDQWMRSLSDVFEAGKVDIVFSGHVHNYQRSYPLRFVTSSMQPEGDVTGTWKLDKNFDGKQRNKPEGVIYIVTGAGGARVYNPEQEADTASWQEFTAAFYSQHHSFSLVEADRKKLTMRQIAEDGKELDRMTISK